MIYTIYADSDSTLYEATKSLNTGLDQILEIHKSVNVNTSESINTRFLLKFDLTDVSKSISNGEISGSGPIKYFTDVYSTENEQEIPTVYSLYAYPVSESWVRGSGRFYNDPATTDGVSWLYRDGKTAGAQWRTGSFVSDVTGSWSVNGGGANWYTSSAASQSFSYEASDIRMDVTDITNKWLNKSIVNNGFIFKRSDSDEQSLTKLGTLQFFSLQTHTVYQPRLEVAWDDSSFVTGSLSALADENITLYFKNLQSEYKDGSKAKIRVYGRPRFPTKTYATASSYLNVKYLPTASYYSIRDAHTEEVLIPFDDNYTKISCDSSGNYFNYWMSGLHPERFYRFVIKVKRSSSDIEYFDNGYIFKVVR